MVVYLDSGDLSVIARYANEVKGFTTNPTLLKQGKVKDYESFAKDALQLAEGKPISFEVFSDDPREIEEQARKISSWGPNIYVKIPVTDSDGRPTTQIIENLCHEGIKVNITALFSIRQIMRVCESLSGDSIISIFAGRIADTGTDPIPIMRRAIELADYSTKVLWASTREAYNIKQAREIGCDIITVSPDILQKMGLYGKDLEQYSLETVRQFKEDSQGLVL